MTTRASLRAIAEMAGVSDKTVRACADAAGIIGARGRNGGYPVEETLRAVEDHGAPARIAGHQSNGRGQGAAGTAAQTLADARARAEIARAGKIELELEIRRGELVERASVEAAGRSLVADARTALLSVGLRLAPRLAGLSDENQINAIITNEVRVVLGALSDEAAFIAEVLS